MSGSAQRELLSSDTEWLAGERRAEPVASALKQAVAERVAEHRGRRAEAHAAEREMEATLRHRRDTVRRDARRGTAAVRDSVLARFGNSPSYREFLAAEAERALEQAQAEAEVATRNARAVADAQLELLAEIEQWSAPAEPSPREQALAAVQAEARGDLAHALADIALGARELMNEPSYCSVVEAPMTPPQPAPAPAPAVAEVSAGGLTVRLYESLSGLSATGTPKRPLSAPAGPEELEHLEEEIDFRRAPEFIEHVLETLPIPGNLIEFPRQLVASRKARPRLAEGPLREDAPGEPQLRIFEVEAELVSHQPLAAEPAGAPEWQSLLLGAAFAPVQAPPLAAQTSFTLAPQIAPVELRLMSAAVDACAVGVAFVGFAAAAAALAGGSLSQMPRSLLVVSAVGTLVAFALLYQLLFFSCSDSTPGMRFARIGLCTFGDTNPSRKAMRRRILSTLLALCPLGLGLLWVWMDDDRLGWHDRMSRMYQRAY